MLYITDSLTSEMLSKELENCRKVVSKFSSLALTPKLDIEKLRQATKDMQASVYFQQKINNWTTHKDFLVKLSVSPLEVKQLGEDKSPIFYFNIYRREFEEVADINVDAELVKGDTEGRFICVGALANSGTVESPSWSVNT